MITKSRIGLAAALTMGGFGLIALSAPSRAELGDDLPKVVKRIAEEIKKGNEAGAKKMAKTAAKKIEELPDLMQMYRPGEKGGLGIEAALKNATAKDAEKLGNLTRAMAELTLAKGFSEPTKKRSKQKWIKFTDNLNEAAKELAKAKSAGEVGKAAERVLNSCSRCHAVFKD